ncbi:MAG: DUF2975 domain-containing protein [Oenococcus sp.]|uniref:DUF2975 domain-containing protein n=1 Tax=Oenococcus sp. TaxID=1979414 RepID=UPI0039E884CD
MMISKKELEYMKIKSLILKLALLGIAAIIVMAGTLVSIQVFTAEGLHWNFAIVTLLAAIYLAAIFAFRVLYLLFRVVSLIGKNQAFSSATLPLVTKIKHTILVIAIVFSGIMPFVYQVTQMADAPGLMIMGFSLISLPYAAFVFSQIVEDLFRSAISLKTEHDLTI